MRFRLTIPAILGTCAVLGACGGGGGRLSDSAYRAQLVKLAQQENGAHADVEKALSAKTVSEIRARMSSFADDQARLGDNVAALKAPEKAQAANAKLAGGARTLSAEIRTALAGLSSARTPKAALLLLNQRLGQSKGAQAMDAALTELRQKGYGRGGG